MGGRLALGIGAGLFALWLASAATALLVVTRELNEVFDSILQESAQILLPDLIARFGERLAAEAAAPLTAPDIRRPIIVTDAAPHDEYITWRLHAADGRLLMRSHGAAEGPALPPGFATLAGSRIYTERTPDGRYAIAIVEPPFHRAHTIRPTLWRLLLPLLVLVLVALLLVPVAIRLGFAPLRSFGEEMSRRGGANLAPLAVDGLPSELLAMQEDVNQLLDRLRRALEAERSFSANAAHEMRTPLAAVQAQAQLLVARLPAGSADLLAAQEMAAGLARLGARVEKLLQLSRVEAGVALKRDAVDLLVPLELVIEDFARRPEVGERLRLEDGGLGSVMVAADLDALAIALRNLVENALRHGPREEAVVVSVGAEGWVRVVNGGPVVPEAQLRALTGRFVTRGAGGSGLGLAIVEAIATQLGGRLELRSPASGRADGFEAVLRLPGLQAAP
jgi:two-component system OmpR family sensor kinase